MTAQLVVDVSLLEVRTGLWCDQCLLPAGMSADFTLAAAGLLTFHTVDFCPCQETP